MLVTEVAILVPVLGRPQRVQPLVDSIRAATPEPHEILFLADPQDVATRDAIALAGGCRVLSPGGSYAQKINVGVRETDTPFVFLAADDLYFHPGWLPAALCRFVGPVGVVGTNDVGNRRVIRGEHATHSLVARWYASLGTIDGQPGLLHEGYRHNFCDDELVSTAKRRSAWAFADDSVVEHLHPHWGKGQHDETYAKGQATFRIDRKHFQKRRALWT